MDSEHTAIFHLPEDIFPDKKMAAGPLILYEYTASASQIPFRGRSILQQHAISLVLNGEKTMQFAERTVHTGAGEFHFLSAGNCLVSMNPVGKGTFSSILLFFGDEVLADFYHKHAALIAHIRANKSFPKAGYLSFRKDAFIHNYIESLRLLLHSGRTVSAEMKLLKFEELMLHLLEKYPETILSFHPAEKGAPEDDQIRRAVESNIVTKITVEELAFLCNLSLSTFKRRFARIYGSTPSRWILLRRMEIAKDLILHHREKPGEVWHKVGYETHSSFSQSFKQVYGIPPKELRQQKLNVLQ